MTDKNLVHKGMLLPLWLIGSLSFCLTPFLFYI